MKNAIVTLSVIGALGVGSFLGEATPAKAAEPKQSSIENQQYEVESNLNLANIKISKLQDEQEKSKQNIENLNNAISVAQQQKEEKYQQIVDAKSKMETLQKEISKITDRIEKRSGLLKDRARSFQETGGLISYMDVVVGAKSFSDFVDRAGAVATIVEADREILQEHQTDKESLEKSQAEMKAELLSLETMQAELEKMEEELILKKEEQSNLMEEIKDKEKAVQAEVLSLEKERTILVNKKTEMEKNSLTEQNSQPKPIAENIQKDQNPAESISKNQNPAVSVSKDPKMEQTNGNGSFIWPTIGGQITTYQGMRWGSFHKGIDIAGPADYSILAADSGTIIFSGWKNGYGNTINRLLANYSDFIERNSTLFFSKP